MSALGQNRHVQQRTFVHATDISANGQKQTFLVLGMSHSKKPPIAPGRELQPALDQVPDCNVFLVERRHNALSPSDFPFAGLGDRDQFPRQTVASVAFNSRFNGLVDRLWIVQ